MAHCVTKRRDVAQAGRLSLEKVRGPLQSSSAHNIQVHYSQAKLIGIEVIATGTLHSWPERFSGGGPETAHIRLIRKPPARLEM